MFDKLLIALGLKKTPVPKEFTVPYRAGLPSGKAAMPIPIKVASTAATSYVRRPVIIERKPYVPPQRPAVRREPEPDTTVEDLAAAALLYSMLNSSSSSSRSDPEPEPFRGGGGDSGGAGASGSWESSSSSMTGRYFEVWNSEDIQPTI